MSRAVSYELLFNPGAGLRPPYIAGRGDEQRQLRIHLDRSASGQSGQCIYLYGPRSNGKTTLLQWLAEEAQQRHPDVPVVRTAPGLERRIDGATLAKALSKKAPWRKILPDEFRLSVPGLFGIGVRKPTAAQTAVDPVDLIDAVSERTPFVLLIDEAHTLDPNFARVLLNGVQIAQGRNRNVMLVLAGTPDLEAMLMQAGASFRTKGRRIPLGLLPGSEAVREAIEKPLASRGWSIEPDALRKIVAESDRCPFFVQLWGEAVRSRVHGAERRAADVERQVRGYP